MGVASIIANKLRRKGKKTAHNAKEGAKSLVNNTSKAFLGAIKGILKAILAVLAPILLKVIAVIIFLGLCNEAISEETSKSYTTASDSFVASGNASSDFESDYKSSGSMVSANDDDITGMKDEFIDLIKNNDLKFLVDFLNKKVSNLNKNNSGIYLETSGDTDPVDLGEDVTLYEHILNSERYNFNRIKWVQYNRGVTQGKTPKLTVDSETRLQYPSDGDNELSTFVSMVKPYLQSSMIPMSMVSGLTDQDKISEFAYAIISEGYHRIQMAEHTIDAKTRVNNYIIYDKYTSTKKVTRTCTPYKYEEGVACTDAQYEDPNNACELPVTSYPTPSGVVQCKDSDYASGANGCTKGRTMTTSVTNFSICKDDIEIGTPTVEAGTLQKDIRENISSNDSVKTDYRFLIESVKAFDYIIKNSYIFEKYYEDNNRYNENLDKVDSYTQEKKDYYKSENNIKSAPANNSRTAPSGVDMSKARVAGPVTVTTYDCGSMVEKKGFEYTDTLLWQDKLNYDTENSYTQKGYNMDNLKDWLGEDDKLSSTETKYYEDLAKAKELNRIDLLNAKKSIYDQYVVEPYSSHIGFVRSYLSASYSMLKRNLKDFVEEHKGGIAYGQSIEPSIDNSVGAVGSVGSYDYSALLEGQFGWPVPENHVVAYLFGYTSAYGDTHGGIDLWPTSEHKGKWVTDVVAAKAGTVVVANDLGMTSSHRTYGGGWGNYIKIDHGNGVYTLYGHLYAGSFAVKVGDKVTAGQVIAKMGSSGDSTGQHLHFELYQGGSTTAYRIDPLVVYQVKSIKGYPEYDTMSLNDSRRKGISSAAAYEVVGSK